MPVDTLPKPELITRPDDLYKLVNRFSEEPILAIDTEANSLYAYREKVCLIQFSIPAADYLVDPLALKDLSPLAPIFADPNIEKVFHAAEYDLIIMKRNFGFHFANLFDTMQAARIIGWKAVGLGSILKAQYGLNLNKRYQRADWGRRPLPPEMLTYAQLDTHYLISLRNLLKSKLEQKERWLLALEDFRRTTHVQIPDTDGNGLDCWRINGSHDLSPNQAAVLQELCRYRDQVARSTDRPLFKVINDQTLLNIATTCPRSLFELAELPGMTKRQMSWHGNALLSSVKRGLKAPPLKQPQRPRPSQAYLVRTDSLRQWRKNKARSMGVESDIVLPKSLLYELALKNPTKMNQLVEILESVPWRLEQFGSEILDLLTRLGRRSSPKDYR
jgi:ribonuclease D